MPARVINSSSAVAEACWPGEEESRSSGKLPRAKEIVKSEASPSSQMENILPGDI